MTKAALGQTIKRLQSTASMYVLCQRRTEIFTESHHYFCQSWQSFTFLRLWSNVSECVLTTPPTTRTPMEVREVREARPVTMETISSSWVIELCGNGGMLVLTGVRAKGRGTCTEKLAENNAEHRDELTMLQTVLKDPNCTSKWHSATTFISQFLS